jgi:dTDP-glucose 4,6-dehydratase
MTWTNKTALVTGAGGFIGSHLAEQLVALGANVRALVHYNALGTWGWLDHSPDWEKFEVIRGDICDRDSVRGAVEGADVVFHLAALIAIPYSYQVPESYLRTNIQGTLNVLQAAKDCRTPRVVHTSTSEVYGTARYVPIDEKHPLQGQSPYSASKIGADKMAEAFHLSFGLPIVTVRPFNTFGPRQSARAVIPTIISQCLEGRNPIRLGSLTPTRDMNFVANTADGFIRAGSSEAAIGQTINLGSGREISVGDLANLIGQLTETNPVIEEETTRLRPVKSEVERLLADRVLAREVLGWEPKISLEDGLQKTIDWMRENRRWYRPGTYAV